MHFVAVKESQTPPGLGIYSWSAKIVHLRQWEGMSFVKRRYTKRVPFLLKMACKRITGGGKVSGPSSYNTLLSAPLAHLGNHYVPQGEAVCSFASCYCHILCFLHFLVFNWNASIFLASKSSVRSSIFTKSIIFHVTRHVSALDQLKHSCTINRGGSSFPERWWGGICPISRRICKLLAVFTGLTIMGWLNLLTKCLIMYLWRNHSKDGFHVAAFSLQNSWSLGKPIEFTI